MLGPHLTLDFYGCDRKKIADAEFVRKLLDELPAQIGMHKISEPQVLFYPGKSGSFDQGGISAFVIIAESHISIHTFLAQDFASVDIFSCKEFDIAKAEEILMESFGAKRTERKLFNRGLEFPKDVALAAPIVVKQRRKISSKKTR